MERNDLNDHFSHRLCVADGFHRILFNDCFMDDLRLQMDCQVGMANNDFDFGANLNFYLCCAIVLFRY